MASILRAVGYVILAPSLFYTIIFVYYEGFASNWKGIALTILGAVLIVSGNLLKKFAEGGAIRSAIKKDLKTD